MDEPIILVGGSNLTYGAFSGGVKHINLWVKLIRSHGYESYILSQDGTIKRWLIEHQPAISLATAKKWKEEGKSLKSLPMWLPSAPYFLGITDKVYYYDCELAHTISPRHQKVLRGLITKSQLINIGTNNRLNWDWYKWNLKRPISLIREWSDEQYWYPRPSQRRKNLVSYTPEKEARPSIQEIGEICRKQNINLEFQEIWGLNEQQTLDAMRATDFFLGMNLGKHPFYGEGCPRAGNEAMHAGCIVIAYDVVGNREYIENGQTGFLIPTGNAELMAERLINLAKNPSLKEKVRAASVKFALERFSSPGRWQLVRKFLELE